MPILNPEAIKIGYVILAATPKPAIQAFQRKAGYGESSKWTHVAGSIGGYDIVEAAVPRSRAANIQKEYIDKGIEIKVMRRRGQDEHKRYKVALWWATMNNLPYDALQFFWFPLSIFCAKIGLILHRLFSSNKRFICSELIAAGFYKEGDYIFIKPQEEVLPADFDNPELFEEIKGIFELSIILRKDRVDLVGSQWDGLRHEFEKETNEIAKIIEQEIGPIDKTYSLIAINFCSQDSYKETRCTEVSEARREIIINLPFYVTESREKWQRSLSLSHELVHTITPCPDLSEVTFLDEGLATVFSERYANGSNNSTNDQKYASARDLAKELLGIDNGIIKKLRKKYPNKKISDYKVEDIRGVNSLISIELAKNLIRKFY